VTGVLKCSIQTPSKEFDLEQGNAKMADHKHGEMDIEVQQKTFDGFMKAVSWSAVTIICVLIFIALVNG
jgi:hypothetical protein